MLYDIENLILTEQTELPDVFKSQHFVLENLKPSKLKSHSIFSSNSMERCDLRIDTKSQDDTRIWQHG